MGALYTISLIDRTNISAARISGIDEDLDLAVGSRASIARKFLLTELLFSASLRSNLSQSWSSSLVMLSSRFLATSLSERDRKSVV